MGFLFCCDSIFSILIVFIGIWFALFSRHNNKKKPKNIEEHWRLSELVSSSTAPSQKKRTGLAVVVGGSGFLGQNLVRRILKEKKYRVRIADIRPPSSESLKEVPFVKTDLCNFEDVRRAVDDAELVFHCATAAPTATNALNDSLMYSVNVVGTRNLLHACAISTTVSRFVYTSTASVVFDGSDLKGADESLPYAQTHLDFYNATKAEAERCVLESNNVGSLLVVALRPSGIFGEDDPQLTPTIVEKARSGKSKYIVGSGNNKFDFTHVGNVCQAHTMAAEALFSHSRVPGSAYFITNADPQNFWNFLGRLLEGLGYPAKVRPHVHLPLWLVFPLAFITEAVLFLISPVKKLQSDMTRTRMLLASAERHISCEKAKRDFGYVPEVSIDEAIKRTVTHFKNLRYSPRK